MPYTDPHYYVTFGGNINELEQWQTGFRCWPTPFNPNRSEDHLVDVLDDISVADILVDVNEMFVTGGTNPVWDGGVSVVWAKVAVINVEGMYATDPILAEQAPLHGAGGSGGPWPQLAMAVSLWSGSNLGRANHGRMYFPSPGQLQCDPNTGQIQPTSMVNSMRYTTLKLLKAINGEVSTVSVNTSPAIMSKLGTGTTKTVAQIGVGPVMDTMRSRRASLDDKVETWLAGDWAQAGSGPARAPVILERDTSLDPQRPAGDDGGPR